MHIGEVYKRLGRCQLSGSAICSHQGGVEGIRKVFQLVERCDGHGGDLTL